MTDATIQHLLLIGQQVTGMTALQIAKAAKCNHVSPARYRIDCLLMAEDMDRVYLVWWQPDRQRLIDWLRRPE